MEFKRSKSLVNTETFQKEIVRRIQIANRQALELHSQEDNNNAIKLLKRAENLGFKVEDEPLKNSLLGYTYNSFSSIYKEIGDLSVSLDYLEKSIESMKACGDTEGLCYSYLNGGIIFSTLKEYSKAREYMLKAIQYTLWIIKYSQNKNIIQEKLSLLAFEYYNAGAQYVHLGNLNEAYGNYIKAKEIIDNNPQVSNTIKHKVNKALSALKYSMPKHSY